MLVFSTGSRFEGAVAIPQCIKVDVLPDSIETSVEARDLHTVIEGYEESEHLSAQVKEFYDKLDRCLRAYPKAKVRVEG